MGMIAFTSVDFRLAAWAIIGFTAFASPAAAQDRPDLEKRPTFEERPATIFMVGIGPALKPQYPGADSSRLSASPIVNVWRDGERMPAETADEGAGFVVVGKRGKLAAGVALSVATGRKGRDIAPGLADVGFGIEAGGFIETYPLPGLRLRGELRQSIGAHKGLVADALIDLVLRQPDDRLVITVGPRLRWGNERFQRAYFGVSAAGAAASGLPAYNPGSGIHAYGAMTGAYYQFDHKWGLFGFAGYDRLTGAAARSPIVVQTGSRNQISTGLALTYRFTIRR